jgi:tagatose 6-phosphate kinase
VIVTITLNPVLRVEYAAGAITAGQVNQVRRVRHRAGGRGLEVARVLHTFGHDVVAAGLAGGSAGELIRTELARAGVATQFTRIAAESRRVVAVADESDGRVTGFAEPAPYITTEELGRLAADYRELLTGATAVVLCGSLPEGLPAEIYGSFTAYAAAAGVPVILDASGRALAHGAARRPALVVPEGAALQESDAAAGLGGQPPDLPLPVALLTGRGVRVLTASGEWRAGLAKSAYEPVPEAAETFRDAVVAGFVPGIALAWSWPDILRHAVALGAAWSPDGGLDAEAYEDCLTAVEVRQLPAAHEA